MKTDPMQPAAPTADKTARAQLRWTKITAVLLAAVLALLLLAVVTLGRELGSLHRSLVGIILLDGEGATTHLNIGVKHLIAGISRDGETGFLVHEKRQDV